MLGKSHRTVTELIVSGSCLFTHESLPVTLLLSVGAYFGATAPDVDQKIKHLTHRTWTHTIWAVVLIGLLAFFLPAGNVWKLQVTPSGIIYPALRIIYLGFAAGYFLHIIEDSFSKQGIIWSYPIKRYSHYYGKPFIAGRHKFFWMYKTGGIEEAWIRWVCFALLVIVWTFVFIG